MHDKIKLLSENEHKIVKNDRSKNLEMAIGFILKHLVLTPSFALLKIMSLTKSNFNADARSLSGINFFGTPRFGFFSFPLAKIQLY